MSSNVTDPAPTLDELVKNCQSPVFQKGTEFQAGDWVYIYNSKTDFTPRVYNQVEADKGLYNIDEILLKDCKLVKVTGKSGTGITEHKKPKEPNNYKCLDTTMNYKDWECRYVKISNETQCGWLTKKWNIDNFQYTIMWCGQKNKYQWVIRDLRNSPECNVAYFDIEFSSKYDASTDIKAQRIQWAGTGLSRKEAIRVRSMVQRGKYWYIRTDKDLPLEYWNWSTGTAFKYTYEEVLDPMDIPGFVQYRRHQAHAPFDGKNYTRTEFHTGDDGFARWDLLVTEPIDSIAFGMVITDTINVRVSDQNGISQFEINNYPVDNSVAPNRDEQYPSTVVLYLDKTYPAGSVITIWLNSSVVTVGEILFASKLDAGFTKVNFKNTFKDYSPTETDQWGNYYYADGVRVKVHTGTVEFPVMSYDQLNRLMLLIGGRRVVINSSDTTENQVPDGRNSFEATMMIARFTKFELSTADQKKRINELGTYVFSIEELV